MINLLYHATIYYEIRKYIQESEPAMLKYEMVIEKAKAHERNVLAYKDHQASHGGANSTPSVVNCSCFDQKEAQWPECMPTLWQIS